MDIWQCFKILELKRDASIDEVTEAYKDLVVVWHPDRFPNNPRLRKKAENRLKLLNHAHEKVIAFLKSKQESQKTEGVIHSDRTHILKSSRPAGTPKSALKTGIRINSRGEKNIKVQSRPWIRFFARGIDYILFACLLKLSGADDIISEPWFQVIIYPFLLTLIWVIPEAILLSLFGATAGKWIFRTSLVDLFQLKPKFTSALGRSLSVWCNGIGMGVLFIAPITSLVALHRLKTNGKTAWDRDGGFSIQHKRVNRFRYGLAVLSLAIPSLFIVVDQDIMVKAWSQIVRLKPDDPKNQLKLGALYAKIGRYDEAIKAYNRAIEIRPDYVRALYHLGSCLLEVNRHEEALEPLKKAVEIQPDDARSFLTLGLCYEKLRLYDEAIEAYDRAIEIRPDYVRALYHLGSCLLEVNRHEEALEPLKKAVEIDPDDVRSHFHLGICYFRLGNMEQAINSLQSTLKINSDHVQAYYQLGRCYFEIGQYKKAIDPFKTAATLNPKEAKFFYGLGVCYAKLREFDNAIGALKNAIRVKPDYPQAYHIMGLTYLSRGERTAALEQYERLKKMDENLAEELSDYISNMPTLSEEN